MQKYDTNDMLQIPMEMRKEVNEKIIYLITNHLTDEYGITQSDVFNSYTGDGGLHGLEQRNFKNFHAYTEAKKRIEQGQFFTPAPICKFLIDCMRPTNQDIIYDLTYGIGNFFNYLPTEENIYGTELDIKAVKVARYLYPKANLEYGDIREYNPVLSGNIVFGNPPFNLEWGKKGESELSQMYYCRKAYQILKHAGFLAMIVPNSFLADEFSDAGNIGEINNMFNFVVQFDLPKTLFSKYGVDSFQTKVLILQKKSRYIQERSYTTQKEKQVTPEMIYQKYVQPLKNEARRKAAYIYFECQQAVTLQSEDRMFQEKVLKLLFDIRRNKNISHKANGCEQVLQQYLKQKKPDELSWEEWEKSKIKKDDVLAYLKKTLAAANKKYRNEKKIVKTNYGFKEKDYSEYGNDRKITSINECVLQNKWIPGYERMLKRKRKAFEIQSKNFADMKEDAKIHKYLKEWSVCSHETGETKKLNPIQSESVNKLLQKRYGALQFAMGSGKSLCTLAMAQYRLEHSSIRNVFIVSTALAINNTWEEILQDYRIQFFRIKKRKDIDRIPEGEIVILTINILTELKKQMKRFMRICSQKAMLVFDESDTISNPYSKRTQAMLSVFRKCRFKVLATGTLTRNNIAEAAPQLELLYNNSINFLCQNKKIYRMKNGEMKEEFNPFWNQPFPAYRKGYELFSISHLPKKITVFGLEKNNQDIYNAEFLDDLLNKTVITKTFEEVLGRKIYKITQVTCPFSQMDRLVYQTAVEKFDMVRRKYFLKYDNTRKDAMFRILQQLLLLLNICADPSQAYGYDSTKVPMKVQGLLKILEHWKDERVAIGVRRIKVAHSYKRYIQDAFADRPVFLITGDKIPCKQRLKIIEKLEKTSNGVLLTTQQSLSESMNIDFVDKIILPELHYNNAAMAQYYFRFIRYTSKRFKQIVYLTYENSIETNLLKMILAKEKLNLFMKNQIIDDEELYERFGIDPEILKLLMTIDLGEDGKIQIKWGEQKIS